MNKLQYKFSGKTTTYYLDAEFAYLEKLVDKDHTILVTDEHIFAGHQKKFGGWNTIVINAGEQFKVQATVDSIVEQLLELGADRKTTLVGIGGGDFNPPARAQGLGIDTSRCHAHSLVDEALGLTRARFRRGRRAPPSAKRGAGRAGRSVPRGP